MDNLRNIITDKILSNIPPQVKTIEYLMEALEISRESVYRRIRGDISFTLEELARLSTELEFSIDELIMKNMPSRIFFNTNTNPTQNPADTFLVIYNSYFTNAYNTSNTKDVESIMVSNSVPIDFIILFENLFKFLYYRWMHQNQESSIKYFYSDVVLPEQLLAMQHKAVENLKKIRCNTIIFDSNIFVNLISEVQYYYKRTLINESEFLAILDDLSSLINTMENIAQTGFYGSDTKYNFYLSSLNIDSCSRYIKYDNQVKSMFFVNSIEPITVMNLNVCTMHKKWLDSMRKYTTLITKSNEILQVKYFNKQRTHIQEVASIPNNYF